MLSAVWVPRHIETLKQIAKPGPYSPQHHQFTIHYFLIGIDPCRRCSVVMFTNCRPCGGQSWGSLRFTIFRWYTARYVTVTSITEGPALGLTESWGDPAGDTTATLSRLGLRVYRSVQQVLVRCVYSVESCQWIVNIWSRWRSSHKLWWVDGIVYYYSFLVFQSVGGCGGYP